MATGPFPHTHTKHPQPTPPTPIDFEGDDLEEGDEADEDHFYEDEEEEDRHYWLHMPTAAKFLLAGGVAGAGELIAQCLTPSGPLTLYYAVSRTCTAPFDRLKIFLITRPPELGGASLSPQAPVRGLKSIGNAVTRIYSEGGVRAFWTGNGLSVVKILPESAIKFFAYESSVGAMILILQLFQCSHICCDFFCDRNASSRNTGTWWMTQETSAVSADFSQAVSAVFPVN